MAYTLKQLTMAWTAVQDGIAPNNATTTNLGLLTNASFTDAQAISAVLNGADSTTAVAVLSYQFFTGKSPTKAGLDYLINSTINGADLNDAYYAKFNLENRFMNFAANLALAGEAATAFAAKYGAMSYADFVASIYETIIGATYARAAGLDPAVSIALIIGRKDLIQVSATSAGMITASSTPQQTDLALKTATAAYLLAEAIKADVGLYAGATNNFMLALAMGAVQYNTDITQTYAPHKGAGSEGTGHAVDNAPTLPGNEPPPQPPTTSLSLVLTPGLDNLTGDVLPDTFTATHLTFTAGDTLDGLNSVDVLNLTATTGGAYTLPSVTITGIETANISNTGGLTANTTSWTGLTRLNATTAGATTLTARSTTDVNATVSNVGAGGVTILNGDDITLDVTGSTSGNIVLLGAKGDIAITRAVTGAGNAGNITITDGANIDITLTGNATGSTGSTRTMGTVFIDASAAAHTVKVSAPTPIADNGVHGALDGPTVTVRDVNYTTTLAGTITTVEVSGFGGSGLGINGSALTTLKASHGTDIHIDNDDAVAAPVTTLNLTLNDVHGDFEEEGVYQVVNLTHGAQDSAIDLQMAALKTLSLGGQGVLKLTGLTAPNLTSVTVSGAAGLTGDLSAPTGLTSVDTTGTTGKSTVTINANQTAFTGGAGDDTVTLSSTTVSKAISLGGGNNLLILAPGATAIGASVDGGGGTEDVLRVNMATARVANLAGSLTGFERLEITAATANTVNLDNLGDFHHVTIASRSGTGVMLLDDLNRDDTLVLTFASNGLDYHVQGDFGAADDALNLVLSDNTGAGLDFGNFSSNALEILNITTVDGGATPAGVRESLSVSGAFEEIVVAGNAGLTLTNSSGSGLHTIDASGITLGGLALTLQAAAAAITITGSATANNSVVTSGGLTSVITYTGGSGSDLVSLTATTKGGAIALGGGDDLLMLGSGIGALTATIDGEGGTRDTVMMTAADAVTASGSGTFASKIVNFERLNLTNVSNQTIDVGALGFHYVIAEDGAGLTLNGMTSGDTLELSDAGAGYTVNLAANGANDVLNLRLSDSAGAGLTFANSLTIADIETLNVTTVDGRTTPTGATEILKITTGGQKVVNISGNAGVDLTLGSTVLTSVDASGITKGGFTWTAGAITGPITIKGAANGTNQVSITQTTGVVTYEGGAGDDTLTANSNNNAGAIIHFGDGDNRIIGYASVVTAGSGDDEVRLGNGGTNIDLGDGDNIFEANSPTTATIKTGSGDDWIKIDSGGGSIDVGSGFDTVFISYGSGTTLESITGLGAGDKLNFSNFNTAGSMGAKLVGQTTLGGYLSIAGQGGADTLLWFELNGDVYIVADQNGSSSFDTAADGLVRLVGVAGALDVSLATVSGGEITFH